MGLWGDVSVRERLTSFVRLQTAAVQLPISRRVDCQTKSCMSLFMVWVLVGWGLGGKELRFVAVQELCTLEPLPR